MTSDEDLLWAAMAGDQEFTRALKRVISEELRMTSREFARASGLGESTLYKMLGGERSPNLRTLRRVVWAVQDIEGSRRGAFIGLIAARGVLEDLGHETSRLGLGELGLREYPALNLEEAIIQAVRAEREGARALVCAPIVSTTIERILHIPVATIQPRRSVLEAVAMAAGKVRGGSGTMPADGAHK